MYSFLSEPQKILLHDLNPLYYQAGPQMMSVRDVPTPSAQRSLQKILKSYMCTYMLLLYNYKFVPYRPSHVNTPYLIM